MEKEVCQRGQDPQVKNYWIRLFGRVSFSLNDNLLEEIGAHFYSKETF